MSDEETVDIPSLIVAAQEYVRSVSSPPTYEGHLVEALLTQLSAALVREQTAKAEAWEEGAKRQWLYGPHSIPNQYLLNPYRPTPAEPEESQ